MKRLYSVMMRYLVYIICIIQTGFVVGQQPSFTVSNAHSHNDYEKQSPFLEAYEQGFGSIEADVFLKDTQLLVAHDTTQFDKLRTINILYFEPLSKMISKHNGYVYADTGKQLQLLIDIKTAALPTLKMIIKQLENYPDLIQCSTLKIVISGNRPPVATFTDYPGFIFFDGILTNDYPIAIQPKIAMLSDNFKRYSTWNGMGKIPEAELAKIVAVIDRGRQLNKPVRFWNAPDIINSWYTFMKLGVGYINTDKITTLGTFLQQFPDRTFTASSTYIPYPAKYRNDGQNKPVKNIIILIGDGTGLAQWYAGYTANKGALNVFSMHYTGLSKTSSYNNYITDSAPGATAISSGIKTNNRAVGVDHTGQALKLLPDIIADRKMKSGIITTGDLTDATPASFYAHQSERSHSRAILLDLIQSPIHIIMGKGSPQINDSINQALAVRFSMTDAIEKVDSGKINNWMVTEARAGLPVEKGRGDWAQQAFDKTVAILSKNKQGFLLMFEAAQIDHGGHANKLPWLASEVMDFDKVIGKAMQFADSNGETLVIVTADHETGGLSLTGGDYHAGSINGLFSSTDHTAIPVPVFAYGPQANLFTGVYENTELFRKILAALKINSK